MISLIRNTAVYAWVVLVLMTTLAWWLSLESASTESLGHQYTTTLLFALAFFKVRLVIIHFMEIGTAPLPLRLIFEAWVFIVCIVLVSMYWLL